MKPFVDDEPAMPDLSDPNKVMTPDEIAAFDCKLIIEERLRCKVKK